ncbi:MAG: glycosyltransferase [Steroidobacteraceae bacterium]
MLIRALSVGGAERQFVNAAIGLHRLGHVVTAVIFYRENSALESQLIDSGVELLELRKASRWDLFRPMLQLARLMRKQNCHVLYSFLPVANLFGALVSLLVPKSRLVWGVRTAGKSSDRRDMFGRFLAAAEWHLIRVPDLVITNSQASLNQLRARGLPDSGALLIDNGVDSERYIFDEMQRSATRAAWGVGESSRLIGAVGRIRHEKGLAVLLRAVAMLVASEPAIRVVLIGDGSESDLNAFRQEIVRLQLTDYVIWAGVRDDMAAVYSALDLLCLASFYEGSPNTLGEAMMCGLVCVATDVGDVRRVLASYGFVANAGDDNSLAEQLKLALQALQVSIRDKVRARALHLFAMDKLVSNTESALLSLIESSRSSDDEASFESTDD